MAETVVENRVCSACGTDIRSNALFCYNCGGTVAPEVVIALKDKKNFVDEEKNGDNAESAEHPVGEVPVEQPIPKPDLPEQPKLQSAAAMRRKSKNLQPKRIEIIWEEHENAPNVWFIAVAIFITLLAAGILYLALQFK